MISTGKNTFEVENMDHSGCLSSVSATNQHLLKQGLSSAVTPRLTQYTGHPAKGCDHETAQNQCLLHQQVQKEHKDPQFM